MQFILRRLLLTVLTTAATLAVVFVMVRLLPGDPVTVMSGPEAGPEQRELIRTAWGLDRPLPVQLGQFFGNIARGEMGSSLRTGRPVLTELLPATWATFQIAGIATLLALVLGVAFGVTGALKPTGWLSVILTTGSLLGVSLPVFWWGLVLIQIFAVRLRMLPSTGMGGWAHLVLPTLTLTLFGMGFIARVTRTALVEVLQQDYIRTARAKGLAAVKVNMKHALRNASIPITTATGLQFGHLMAGAVLTETVFGWPGLGQLLVRSILVRDYPIVQGGVIIIGVMFALLNLLTDLTVDALNPSTR